MNFQPNALYYKMAEIIADCFQRGVRPIIINEGSSRSAKTYDYFHLLVSLCDSNRNKGLDNYIYRDTLVNCRDSTLKDFKRALGRFSEEEFKEKYGDLGMQIWDEKNFVGNPKPVYKLWGNTVSFKGLDTAENEAHASDTLFFNEGLEMDKAPVDGLIMRCRKFVVIDFNPRLTNHWIFDMKGQPEVYFTHSTYKQNRFLTRPIIQGIEKTSPWLIEDCTTDEEGKALIPEDKRRPHEGNIADKTVDKWRWEVYGMGRRANKEGLIFPNVTWIDEFPNDIEDITYGMDFGMTAQTAIAKAGIRLMETGKHKLYLKKLFYLPTEDSDIIGKILYELGIDRPIYSDNNKPGWIVDLRRMKNLQDRGCIPLVTKKFDGSREYWIDSIKKFDIHIVKDTDFQTEQENFKHLIKDGIQLSEAEKKWDHLWSASGYAVVGKWRTIVGDPKQKN